MAIRRDGAVIVTNRGDKSLSIFPAASTGPAAATPSVGPATPKGEGLGAVPGAEAGTAL